MDSGVQGKAAKSDPGTAIALDEEALLRIQALQSIKLQFFQRCKMRFPAAQLPGARPYSTLSRAATKKNLEVYPVFPVCTYLIGWPRRLWPSTQSTFQAPLAVVWKCHHRAVMLVQRSPWRNRLRLQAMRNIFKGQIQMATKLRAVQIYCARPGNLGSVLSSRCAGTKTGSISVPGL